MGAVEYVEALLTGLDEDPPHVWAGPEGWLELGPWERHAWSLRIADLQAVYTRVGAGGQVSPEDARVLHTHAIEASYGDPAYGGNRERAGWTSVAFLGDVQPRGWTDDEVITGG